MKKSTLLHLRVPFSFFLLPVFLFASASLAELDWVQFSLVFFVLHFLVYPASNAYNSYFDRDEGSIGGLKHPPEVSKQLYHVALLLDALAVVLAYWVSAALAAMILIYGLMSKGYSHPMIRWKSRPLLGWLVAGIFQGYFTFLMTVVGVSPVGFAGVFAPQVQFGAVLSSLMLFGSYPMTQVYQHAEDQSRGDLTLSIKLGIRGTFHFTALCFGLSTALFYGYFSYYYVSLDALIFIAVLGPVLLFFGWWYLQVRKDVTQASYDHTMTLNWLSATVLNGFFLYLLLS